MSWAKHVNDARSIFESIAAQHDGYNVDAEIQLIETTFSRNWKLQKADANAIHHLMVQIASVGLSLNPVSQFAFIQDQAINLTKSDKTKKDEWVQRPTLNIMYRGLIEILTSSGAANWIRADVVRESDEFNYYGPYEKPTISIKNAFSRDRGAIVGAYAVAQLPDGVTYFCEIIGLDELNQIKQAGSGGGAWSSFESEMQKKAPIKRIFKTIPKNPKSMERINSAIAISSASDGYDFSDTGELKPDLVEVYSQDKFDANWPAWVGLVQSGKRTAREIVNQLKAGCSLSEDQLSKIEALFDHEPIEGDVVEAEAAEVA